MSKIKETPLFVGKAPLLIAHRGYTPVAPENSLASFEAAARRGYWAIETDVHQTLDGVLVCCHNFSLKRMFGADMRIEEHTLSELSGLKMICGNNVDTTAPELLRLPLFSEYLDICESGGCVPFIETKGEVVGRVIEELRRRDIIDRSVLSSANFEHIEEARRLSGEIFIHHIFTTDELLCRIAQLGYGGVSFNYPVLDEAPADIADRAHALGVRICLRAGDTPENVRRMMAMGLDYIPTNCTTPADID